MKLKVGMLVKLQEIYSCGCDSCEEACNTFHTVTGVSEYDETVYLDGCGEFYLNCDFIIKSPVPLENK